jgi:EthD domain-containing protein
VHQAISACQETLGTSAKEQRMSEPTATRIKMFGLLAPRPGLDLQEFHDHYRHPHGTWGLHVSLTKGYVQSHRIDSPALGTGQRRFDIIAELWFDSIADLARLRAEPMMVRHLNADEQYFIDFDRSVPFIGVEEVLTSGPDPTGPLNPGDELWSAANRPLAIKLVQLFAIGKGLSWISDADKHLGLRIGALRHVRCHALPFGDTLGGAAPEFGGIRELWWPTLSAFQQGIQSAPDAWAALSGNSDLALLVQAERYL